VFYFIKEDKTRLTHRGELTRVVGGLMDAAQVAVDPLEVHHALDAVHPGAVFSGELAGATKLGVEFRGGAGERQLGAAGGVSPGRGRSLAGGRGGERRVGTG